jgi:hypothetical protein
VAEALPGKKTFVVDRRFAIPSVKLAGMVAGSGSRAVLSTFSRRNVG